VAREILLVTSGIFHPPYQGRQAVARALRQMEGYAFRRVPSLEALPADPGRFSALVLYYHHRKISDRALERLRGFVSGGGGILAIHSATASFKQSAGYFEILGGRFIGHGPVESFEVRSKRYDIFRDFEPFTVRDELYLHELQPGVDVQFTIKHDGTDVPAVWTHRYGAGRVCYAMPGHTTNSLKNPSVQEILRRGLQWVCGTE